MKIKHRPVLWLLVLAVAIGSIASNSTRQTEIGTSCTRAAVVYVSGAEFCVANFTGSGWELLEAAKLTPEGTAEYPNSFVCRIGGQPGLPAEDCVGTPGVNGNSWHYYIWDQNRWLSSPVGAASRRLGCADADAWVFGSLETHERPNFSARAIGCD